MATWTCQLLAESLGFLGGYWQDGLSPATFCDSHALTGNARILASPNGQVPIHSLSLSPFFLSLPLHCSPVLLPLPTSPYLLPHCSHRPYSGQQFHWQEDILSGNKLQGSSLKGTPYFYNDHLLASQHLLASPLPSYHDVRKRKSSHH